MREACRQFLKVARRRQGGHTAQPTGLDALNVATLMHELERKYTMAEERVNHSGKANGNTATAPSSSSDELTFF